jgi:ParB-like chromosome segregation protein Spo0J
LHRLWSDRQTSTEKARMLAHPIAELFPMLSPADLESLAADIKSHGLRRPIVIDDQDRIIDGRNRQAACDLAGVKPTYEPFVGTEREIAGFVASENIHRRHLTASQRADIAARIANLPAHRPNKQATLPTSEPPVTQAEAAEIMGVSERSVRKARKVREKGTKKLQQSVAAGEVSVSRAAEIAELPKPQQNSAVSEFFDKRPKPKVFDDSQWDKLIGPVVRYVGARAEHLGGKCRRYTRLIELLSGACDEFKAWQAETVI